jgi:hypothetical protein
MRAAFSVLLRDRLGQVEAAETGAPPFLRKRGGSGGGGQRPANRATTGANASRLLSHTTT